MQRPKVEDLCSGFRLAERIEDQFEFAQAICATAAPTIQAKLDTIRRNLLSMVRDPPAPSRGRSLRQAVAVLRKVERPAEAWTDFVFTPELDRDDCLEGIMVPNRLVVRLRASLMAQHSRVKSVLRRRNIQWKIR